VLEEAGGPRTAQLQGALQAGGAAPDPQEVRRATREHSYGCLAEAPSEPCAGRLQRYFAVVRPERIGSADSYGQPAHIKEVGTAPLPDEAVRPWGCCRAWFPGCCRLHLQCRPRLFPTPHHQMSAMGGGARLMGVYEARAAQSCPP
jgi:hypothetical protein